jgi:hypothetical protein
VTIKIDKNIPIPPRTPGIVQKYPWTKMGVGDSFFLPCDDIDHARRQQTNALVIGNQHHGERRFTTRLSYDPPGVRVWRIK